MISILFTKSLHKTSPKPCLAKTADFRPPVLHHVCQFTSLLCTITRNKTSGASLLPPLHNGAKWDKCTAVWYRTGQAKAAFGC